MTKFPTPGASSRRSSTAGFMGALAAVGKLKLKDRTGGQEVTAAMAASRTNSLDQGGRFHVSRLLSSTPHWNDVPVERICDVIASADHGKNRIKKLKFARNTTLWKIHEEITRHGVYYVLSGTCQFTRKVRIVPKKEMKEVDPELQVFFPPSLLPSPFPSLPPPSVSSIMFAHVPSSTIHSSRISRWH